MLSNGAPVNTHDPRGFSLLHYAAFTNQPDLVAVLIAFGSGVDKQDTACGLTPLHMACSHGCLEACHVLLRCEANPNIRDKSGAAPLHYLAGKESINPWAGTRSPLWNRGDLSEFDFSNCLAILKCLLEYGARLDLLDEADLTPSQYAGLYAHMNLYGVFMRLENMRYTQVAPDESNTNEQQEVKTSPDSAAAGAQAVVQNSPRLSAMPMDVQQVVQESPELTAAPMDVQQVVQSSPELTGLPDQFPINQATVLL